KPGDVIVVDAGGETETSVVGGLMGGLAKNRGIAGMIVDGAGRDIDELRDIGWPIFTRAITARGTHTVFSRRKEDLSLNVPIVCGGVGVDSREMVVFEEIWVLGVPRKYLRGGILRTKEKGGREAATREWVKQGKTVEDLLREFGRI